MFYILRHIAIQVVCYWAFITVALNVHLFYSNPFETKYLINIFMKKIICY